MEEFYTVEGKKYRILRLLGHGKGGYSWLVTDGQSLYTLKKLHHEPCSYYTFSDKFQSELNDRQTLENAGVFIPKMYACDREQEILIKEYIEGDTVLEEKEKGKDTSVYIPAMRAEADRLKKLGLNIDYYPANFIFTEGRLCYLDWECNPYMEQWDFDHWGAAYWLPEKKEKKV